MTALGFLAGAFPYFGLAGCAVILITTAVSGLAYRGRRGEAYSAFNHFISELGERGVSARADVFNAGLIAAGVCFVPFIVGLAARLGGAWAGLGAAAGVVTAAACIGVGALPMNNLTPHTWAAMTYFRAGLAMVLFFTIAIAAQPAGRVAVPKASLLFSLLACASYAGFLALVRGRSARDHVPNILDPEAQAERPRFWALPAVEWCIFFSTVLWFFAVAVLALV